jgi:hypothetical protein
MATIGGPATTTLDKQPSDIRLTPENYTTVDALKKATKDFVLPDLVESYGDQGITGFLNLVGAVKAGGTSDQVDWWESGRRHKTYAYADGSVGSDVITLDDAAIRGASATDAEGLHVNDVVMDSVTGVRLIVKTRTAGTSVVLVRLDGEVASGTNEVNTSSGGTLIHIGNLYGQGTNQPSHFQDSDIKKYRNPFMIVKDRYQVNGSQATNIGWVNLGGGEYRWFMYGEQEARKRFEDRREMMMLFGEIRDGASDGSSDAIAANAKLGTTEAAGSQGYVSAVEERGIVISNANANPMDSFSEFDDLILQLDKQGAPSEYAMYLNRKQDLAIDDMLASGIATSVTAGLPGQFGAFNNDSNMAVKLGFKSFTRGGYTFHKHDWKLLNDPTLMGASNYLQGAMIPLTNVTDARSGAKAPALAMYYKEANGYSRELDHWITGGGVMGHTNNGDTGADVATFHYRSEIALVTRAANQHVIIKG